MIVVGVSRHGRLRRLFTGTTGDRIASLAGRDRRAPGHPRRGRPARRAGGGPLSPLVARRQVAGWVAAVVLPVRADRRAAPVRRHRPAAAGRRCSFLAGTVLVALVGGLLPGAARGRRRLPAPQLVLHPAGRHVHRRRAEEPAWPCWSSSRSRPGSRRWSTGPRGGPPRRPGPAPRPPRSARCPGRCSPARTPPRRSWSGCARRSARTPSSLLDAGPGGLDRWSPPAATRAPATPTRATPGSAWTTTTCSRCAGEPLRATRPAGAGGVRRADRPGAGVPTAARARGPGGRAGARRGDLDRAAAGGLPRPADPAGDHADRGRRAGHRRRPAPRPTSAAWSPRVDDVDRPARAPHRQPARPVPAAVRAGQAGAARPQPRRGAARSRSPGTRRAPSSLEVDESAPMVLTDAGLLERVVANLVGNAVRVSDGKPVRVLAHVLPDDRRDHGRRPRPRRTARRSGSGCSSRSSGSTTPRRAASGSVWPWPAASTEAIGGDALRRGHPRRRADHGAVGAPRQPAERHAA